MKVALVLGAVAALTLVPGGAAQSAYVDPRGDQVPFEDLVAPDITSVEVVNTRDGVIGFRVVVANYAQLPPRSRIAILFDLDRSFSTGDNGFEYAVSHRVDEAGAHSVLFERWNEQNLQMAALSPEGLSSTFEAGSYTLLIPRRRLENTAAFDFGLYAALFHATRQNRAAVDSAPNANIWTFQLTGLPPPRLTASTLVLTPRRPVAGRQFRVSAVVRRADAGTVLDTATVACSARLGTAPLRTRGSFRGRSAHCTITIPATARGKSLRGSITVQAHGARLTKRFAYRVQ
jgi:hypothetical protein